MKTPIYAEDLLKIIKNCKHTVHDGGDQHDVIDYWDFIGELHSLIGMSWAENKDKE